MQVRHGADIGEWCDEGVENVANFRIDEKLIFTLEDNGVWIDWILEAKTWCVRIRWRADDVSFNRRQQQQSETTTETD